MCGDSGSKDDVASLFRGVVPDAVVTDPPYGQGQPGVTNDEPDKLEGIVRRCLAAMPMRNGVCVAFSSPRTFVVWLDEARAAGHKFERMLWLYKEAQMSRPWRGWLLKSDAIVVTSVGDGQWNDVHPYRHDCYVVPVVLGQLPDGVGWHGSVKSLAVTQDLLCRVCPPGGKVYEPFNGSGTTMIAAAEAGRIAFCMEIDPRYVDVARRRFTI